MVYLDALTRVYNLNPDIALVTVSVVSQGKERALVFQIDAEWKNIIYSRCVIYSLK